VACGGQQLIFSELSAMMLYCAIYFVSFVISEIIYIFAKEILMYMEVARLPVLD